MSHHLADHAAHMFHRLVQETFADVAAEQWRRRADEWDRAAPRRSDFHGKATCEQIQARIARCEATALACRAHADLVEKYGQGPVLVTELDWDLVEELCRAAA